MLLGATPRAAESSRRKSLIRWVLDYQVAPSGLCRYYRFGPYGDQESPLATAYAILLLREAYPDTALSLARGLARLQAAFAENRHVGGGVPSVANDDSRLFYSSDALVCLHAVLSLHESTGASDLLESADGFVRFVTRMTQGRHAGLLADDVGFPMQYATPDGVYQNWLVPNISMLFWDTLRQYAAKRDHEAAATLFGRGANLLRDCQSPDGCFYDHYDPGYPPVDYNRSRWRWKYVRPDGTPIAIGDNSLMSALGARRIGLQEMSERYLQWVRPVDGAAFYAYLDARTAGSGFAIGANTYYDVVCSGMYGQLLANLGRLDTAVRRGIERVAAAAQAPDGGYRWGLRPNGEFVQDNAEALVTGYWLVEAL
ncbi:MAG TPA: hypothetical protein VIW73_12750 [Candidatus Cybelea sp.]